MLDESSEVVNNTVIEANPLSRCTVMLLKSSLVTYFILVIEFVHQSVASLL